MLLAMYQENIAQVDYLWDKIELEGQYSIYRQGIELPDRRLLILSYRSSKVCRIEILSEEGFPVKRVDIAMDSLENEVKKIFVMPETNQLFLLGSAPPNFLTLNILDSNLNLLHSQKTELSGSKHLFQIDGIHEGNNLLLVGNALNGFFDTSEQSRIWFLKINTENYKIENQLITLKETDLFGHCYSIVKDLASEGYLCFGAFLHKLDKNFKHTEYKVWGDYVTTENQVKAIIWNDRSYMVGSSYGSGTGVPLLKQYSVTLQEFDPSLIRERYNGIKQPYTHGFYSPVFDFKYKKYLYLGGGDNLTIKKNTGFSVAQFDSVLTKKWEFYFAPDPRYKYTPTGLLATSDGGVIVYGARYDHLGDKIFRTYMIKFDAQGGLSWSQDPDLSDSYYIKTFPNPSTEGNLTMEVKGPSVTKEFRLFDIQGKNIFADNLSDGANTFNFNQLPSGQYIIKIYFNSKEIYSHYWVKI
jgi:hypothetical protein